MTATPQIRVSNEENCVYLKPCLSQRRPEELIIYSLAAIMSHFTQKEESLCEGGNGDRLTGRNLQGVRLKMGPRWLPDRLSVAPREKVNHSFGEGLRLLFPSGVHLVQLQC